MGNLVLNGATSGATTLTPTDAVTTTVTFPSLGGTAMVSGNMPVFSAYLTSSQFFSVTTATKIVGFTKEFDTANCFNASTGTFTPNVAGYYQINIGSYPYSDAANPPGVSNRIYKNGAMYKIAIGYVPSGSPEVYFTNTISEVVYMNGSTDYLEFYGYYWGGSGNRGFFANGTPYTHFSGTLIRAA